MMRNNSKIPTVKPNLGTKKPIQTIKNNLGPPSKLIRPNQAAKQVSKIEKAPSSNLIQIRSKSGLDLKQNKKELIDTRPQSVVVEKVRSISRSSTKHDILPGKNLKLHKPGALPGYLKKSDKETTQKIEIGKNETKEFEKSVETGDFSQKVSNEIDLLSIINELKTDRKKLLEENTILKEKEFNQLKELEKNSNYLKAKEDEVERLNEILQFEKKEKSRLAKEIEDFRNSETYKTKMIEDTQKEMKLTNEQYQKQSDQIQTLQNQNSENCKEIASLETENEKLKIMIKNNTLEKNKEIDDNTIYENKINEFKQKNKMLQNDLEIAHQQLKNSENILQFNQELLQIRSNLIDTMQEKETSSAKQINDLQKEIISRDESYELELQKWERLTQEVDMNDDINNKSEVLLNLFSTVSSQQMEISKKDQTILYLKETIDKMTKNKKRREELLNQVVEKSQTLSRR